MHDMTIMTSIIDITDCWVSALNLWAVICFFASASSSTCMPCKLQEETTLPPKAFLISALEGEVGGDGISSTSFEVVSMITSFAASSRVSTVSSWGFSAFSGTGATASGSATALCPQQAWFPMAAKWSKARDPLSHNSLEDNQEISQVQTEPCPPTDLQCNSNHVHEIILMFNTTYYTNIRPYSTSL